MEYGQCLQGLPVQNFSVDKTFSTSDERKVLMELYSSTDGETSWIKKTHWNTSAPHCSWFGITCLNDTGYVISINLIGNNLTGKHPNNFWKLRNMLGLCTGGNPNLTGNVSEIISSNMTNLIRIDLAFSHLKGELPQHITQLTRLLKIQLCCQLGEGLTGAIPNDIGKLTELLVLSLGENDLSGTIPESIGKLSKLYFLDFETLWKLNGSIELFLNLISLKGMHLTSTGIHGRLPEDFGHFFPVMEECFLSGNDIRGRIPSSIDKMQNLQQLKLARNRLEGKIPKAIGRISSLKILDLSNNRLTSLQENITFYGPSLETVLLANNNFSTPFFDLVHSLLPLSSSLRILNVSNSGFSGNVPQDLLKFKNIIYLDLQKNKLFGPLPSVHDPLPFLVYMDVSQNFLTGPIPSYYVEFYALLFLDISGNPKMSAPKSAKKPLQNFIKIDFTSFRKRNHTERFSCPNGILSFSSGRLIMDPEYYHFVFCVCDKGYYGFDGKCKKCMHGASCSDTKNGFLYPSTMTMSAGHWPSPSFKNVTHLLRCPGSRTITQKQLACNPSGACTCQLTKQSEPLSQFITECHVDCICHKGGTGRFCSKCAHRYYKRGTLCYPCEDYKLSWYIYLLFLFLTILILWLATFYAKKRTKIAFIVVLGQLVFLAVLRCLEFIPGWLFEIHVVTMIFSLSGKVNLSSGGTIKITVFYLQIVDALLSENDIWPQNIIEVHYYFSNVINFHFSGLACQLPYLFSPLGKLLFAFLLPVAFILVIWFHYGVLYGWYFYHNNHADIIKLRCNCLKLTVVCLNLTYFPVVKSSLSVLAPCNTDGNVHFMAVAPWIECEKSNQTFLQLQIVGAFSAFVYGITIPVVLFPVLLKKYYCERDSMQPNEKELLDSWLGSIYLPYKQSVRHYFEVVAVLRKLLIALMMSIVPVTSSYHTLSVCLVLSLAIVISLSLTPYDSSLNSFPMENVFDALVLFVLLHSFMLVRIASLDAESKESLMWLIVIANLVLTAVLVVAPFSILSTCAKKHSNREQLTNLEPAE